MRLHGTRLWIMGSVALLTVVLWMTVGHMLATEYVLSTSVPVFVHRWVVVDLSYRCVDSAMDDSSGIPTVHELHVRAGVENTVTDTYDQFADVVLPLWPLQAEDGG